MVVLAEYRTSPPIKIKTIVDLALKRKVKIKYVNRDKINRLTKESKHNGIAVKCSERKYTDLKKFSELKPSNTIILVDKVTDAYNFSTIIKSCVFLGSDVIVVSKEDRPQLTHQIAKYSSGALDIANIYSVKFIKEFLSEAKGNGFTIIGVKSEKEKDDFVPKERKQIKEISLEDLQANNNSKVVVFVSSELESHLNSLDMRVNIKSAFDHNNPLSFLDTLNPGVSVGLILNKIKSKI